MHKLEKMYCITYNSWDVYYAIHTPGGEILFYKDEQGLHYINLLEGSDQDMVMMLVQEHAGMQEVDEGEGMSLVQTVHGKYKR